MRKPKIVDYYRQYPPKNGWDFVWRLVKSKEFKWILLAIIIILIWNPDWIIAIKTWIIEKIK